jgi:hypothetical protein
MQMPPPQTEKEFIRARLLRRSPERSLRQRTCRRCDRARQIIAAEDAGFLRESVVPNGASWCQLQRAPLGKLLNVQATLNQLPAS